MSWNRATLALPTNRPPFFDHPGRHCVTADPNLFFPAQGGHGVSMARAMCSRCPVKQECREWGIRHEGYGIWGGLTAEDREQIRTEQSGTQPRNCEVCATRYMPNSARQRACGSACARRLKARGQR